MVPTANFLRSPLLGNKPLKRSMLAFFRGDFRVGKDPRYSRGIRQKLHQLAQHEDWRQKYNISIGTEVEVPGGYSELLSSSIFCLALPGKYTVMIDPIDSNYLSYWLIGQHILHAACNWNLHSLHIAILKGTGDLSSFSKSSHTVIMHADYCHLSHIALFAILLTRMKGIAEKMELITTHAKCNIIILQNVIDINSMTIGLWQELLFEGDGYSSRGLDAILNGCLPVVIMDNVEVEFETIIDWKTISLRIKEVGCICL